MDHPGRNRWQRIEYHVTNGPTLKLQPGSVVICDNLASDYTRAAASALRDIGYWLLYRPSYSPALNPVEMACPNPKAHLRRSEPRPFDQGFDAFTEICNPRSPDDCWNVFCEAGDRSNEKRGAFNREHPLPTQAPVCAEMHRRVAYVYSVNGIISRV